VRFSLHDTHIWQWEGKLGRTSGQVESHIANGTWWYLYQGINLPSLIHWRPITLIWVCQDALMMTWLIFSSLTTANWESQLDAFLSSTCESLLYHIMAIQYQPIAMHQRVTHTRLAKQFSQQLIKKHPQSHQIASNVQRWWVTSQIALVHNFH